MGDSAYSFSLTTFSRTGKLLQIEYALNAVANGRTSLGICAKDGVVIATDKKLTSELVDVEDVHKVELLTPSCGVCYAGVGPDFRVLGELDQILVSFKGLLSNVATKLHESNYWKCRYVCASMLMLCVKIVTLT